MENVNLLKITDLSREKIEKIFTLTDEIKANTINENSLTGKSIITFFPASSLRTRITFELAIKQLNGTLITFPSEALTTKESLIDVGNYLNNWIDLAIIRYPDLELLQELAKFAEFPIINAMTKQNHPCEILSDLYSIREINKDLSDLKFCFVGFAGNICNSWFEIAQVMKLNLIQICPKGFEVDSKYINDNNLRVTDNLLEGIEGADFILTDSLPNYDKIKKEIEKYRICSNIMKKAKKTTLLNPCPPFFRGQEVSDEVILSEYFVGYEFKRNLLPVQKAIILFCLGLVE